MQSELIVTRRRWILAATVATVGLGVMTLLGDDADAATEVVAGQAPATPGSPTVDAFTPGTPDCDASEVTASWSTTSAQWVTIAIDGEAIYGDLPADGEVVLPYDCSAEPVLTLAAIGADGRSAAATVTP